MKVTVKVENAYECGRESESVVEVEYDGEQDLLEWFEDEVYPLTGDGHSCGASENANHEVRIIGAPSDRLDLIGTNHEWG